MKKVLKILEEGNIDKVRTLFSFDVTTENEIIRKQFGVWVRYFYPKFYSSKDAPFHKDMDTAEIRLYKGGLKYLINAIFRGGAKTTRKKLFLAFCIANDRGHFRKFLKVLSKDIKNAKQIITDIFNILIQPRFRYFYPEIFEKTDEKREETMLSFTTATGIKIMAGSVGTDQRGQIQEENRPDYILFDDFETRKTLRSAVEGKAIWDNMEEARTGLSLDGSCAYLCNYVSEAGNVHKLIEKYRDKDYAKTFIIPIHVNKVPTWGARYTWEEIQRILADADDPHGEYMCNPSAGSDVFVDRNIIDRQEKKETVLESAGFKIFHKFNPSHRYAGGADIGGGVGLDSSTSVWIDFSTFPCKVVATYANNKIIPEDFGHELVRQGNAFGNPLLAPERNYGTETILILKQKYRGKIYIPVADDTAKIEKKVTKYGWHTNVATKPEMLHGLKKAVEEGHLELSDPDLIREVRSYTRNDLMDKEVDPRLTTRHFDLLVACAIAWQMKQHATAKPILQRIKKAFDPYSYSSILG